MKKVTLIAIVFASLLALGGCGGTTNKTSIEPVDFIKETNQQITFHGINFSFPAYYDFLDPQSTEEQLYYYPENENYSCQLFFYAEEANVTPAEFKTAKQTIAENILANMGDASSPTSSEDITVAGLSGLHITTSIQEDDKTTVLHLVIINNIHEGKLVVLFQEHDSKDQSDFDYDGDFIKILESATLVKSSTSESIITKPEEPVESVKPSTGGEMIGSGTLGDYYVEIKSATLVNDYEGNPALVVTYAWTNNSDKTTSALTSVSEKAFQDGVELDSAFILDSSVYDSGSSMKDVRPGVTIDVQCAFSLTNETSEVEVEISEWISFSGDKVVKTFKHG